MEDLKTKPSSSSSLSSSSKFKRIILSFDDQGFLHETENIQNTANALNNAIDELYDLTEIKLSDDEIEMFLLDRTDPGDYIKNQFSDERPAVRKILQNELRTEFNITLRNNYIYDEVNRYRTYLKVKNGSIIIERKELEKLKPKFENSLDTERAVKANDLHLKGFEAIKELIQLASENGIYLRPMDFFDYLNLDGEIKMQKMNYNKF